MKVTATAIPDVMRLSPDVFTDDRGYFFESDMLFRLYTIRAVVRDVPMPARYQGETSNLRIGHVAAAFPLKYLRAAFKRIFYAYFLRDFNAGTLQLFLGLLIAGSGATYGAARWIHSSIIGVPTTYTDMPR